jgi:hypothetical protein
LRSPLITTCSGQQGDFAPQLLHLAPQTLAHQLQGQTRILGVEAVGRLGQLGLAVVLRGDDDAVLHVAIGADQDDQHPSFGQAQELDVPKYRRFARRGDDPDKTAEVAQHLGRVRDDPLRLVGLQLPLQLTHLGFEQRRLGGDHGVHEQAVTQRGGNASRAGVGAGDEAQLLQVGHHVADGGWAQLQARCLAERARAHGQPIGDVALHQGLQQGSGSVVQHGLDFVRQ